MPDPTPPNIIHPDQPIAVPPQSNLAPGEKKKGSKKALVILVALVLIIAAAVVLLILLKPAKSTITKKDIPQLNVGFGDSTDVSQEYPFDSQITDNAQVDTQLFEGLVQYRQLTQIVPLLATSWYNPDNTSWVFNLRQGVKFHSGRTMTAQDVKYSLDYAVAHQNDNDQSNVTALASTIKQVSIINPYQVKITTSAPDPVLLNRLTYLYILDSKSKPSDFNDGTGPYIIKPGTKPSSTVLDLTAATNYWGGHVYTRNLHFQTVSNVNQLISDTQKGKFDLAGDFSTDQLSKLKSSQAIHVPDIGTSVLVLNTVNNGSPLQSLQGRQAAAYALNKPAIIKAGGLQAEPANQVLPVSLTGYDPSIKAVQYDPAKARQLLASVKNATAPITLSYVAIDAPIVTEVAKELTAAGFNIKTVQSSDISTLVNDGLAGKYDMFFATATSSTLDGADLLNSVLVNNEIYHNSQVNSLLDQADNTLNPSSRLKTLQDVSQLVASDIPAIPLFNADRVYSLSKPYTIPNDIPSADVGAYFWQVYQK